MADEIEIHSITSAAPSLTKDQRNREVRYLFSMGLRTFCFVGAILASGVLRWVLMAGAVFLPYFAVVIANAGRERGAWRGNGAYIDPNTKPELKQ